MSKDLEIIEKLEGMIEKELPLLKFDDIMGKTIGYSVSAEGNVIGLNLNGLYISKYSILEDLKGLRRLSFSFNETADWDFRKELKRLDQLALYTDNENITELRLNRLGISKLSLGGKLINLSRLDLSGNKISDLSFLKELWELEHLNLSNNLISSVAPLKGLKKLTQLYLSENQISDASIIKEFKNLIHLALGSNQITDILFLKELKNLTELYLEYNQISDTAIFRDFKKLSRLDISSTQISDYSFLKELKNLTQLGLNDIKVEDFSFLKQLKGLTHLSLVNDQITDISFVKELKGLIQLDLKKNQITRLPEFITETGLEIKWEKFFYGEGINLYDNPIETPPVEVVTQGIEAIAAYFSSLKDGKVALNEVKVLLVGDGGAGKTSLAKRLVGKKFNKNESQTHGININFWNIKHDNIGIRVHLWDFGGQEIMHATHQFFLSKRSLYILVLDGRRDEKTEYWLKLIESFGGDSPVLVVLNKIDQNSHFDVNRKFLTEKYKNVKGFFRISCAKNVGIDVFSHALRETLSEMEMLVVTWPVSWFNVKNRLENIKTNFLSYEEYLNICADERITVRSAQTTLVDFLNDLGIILHFKDLALEDTHVLEPKWVAEAVYKIINSPILAKSKGVLELSLLNELLKQKDEDDYYYPPDKFRYIIELMKKFELCYMLDGEHVLIPDLLEVQESRFDIDYKSSLKFIFEYDFLPRSVIPRFIVRSHKDIKEDMRWRTGVVLENKSFGCISVVKADYEEKRIYIYVQGEQKRDYFSVIRHTLNNINDSFEKLNVVEKVPLPGDEEMYIDYKELVGYERMGKNEYFVGKIAKTFSISQLLDGIEKESDRRKSYNIIELSPKIEINPNLSVEAQIVSQKQKIGFADRRDILELNSPESADLKKYKKLYKLYEKAYRLEKDEELTKSIDLYEEIIDTEKYFRKAWEGLERIYKFLGESEKRETALGKIRIISDIIDFEMNANKKINLSQIEIYNLEFYVDMKWSFQPITNILLGKNGYGKSHLLRLIISLLQEDDYIASEYFYGKKQNSFIKLNLERDGIRGLIHRSRTVFEESIGKVPILAIPDMRFLDKSKTVVDHTDDPRTDLREYGAFHFLYKKPYDAVIQNFLYRLCISYMQGGESFDIPIFRMVYKVIHELADKAFKFYKIKRIPGSTAFRIEVITDGNENNPLPIQYASQGTLSVLSIFGLIYDYLTSVFQVEESLEEEVLKKPGIVFIDELDAHIHPVWQQKIIRLLRENFPNIQFFVTAHSPLVSAGTYEKEVNVLRKVKSGFIIEQIDDDLIGETTPNLYWKLFDTEDIDETYLYFDNKYYFKEEVESKIKELEHIKSKRDLTSSEESELNRLYREIYYIEKTRRLNRFEIENDKDQKIAELEAKIKELENRLDINLKGI